MCFSDDFIVFFGFWGLLGVCLYRPPLINLPHQHQHGGGGAAMQKSVNAKCFDYMQIINAICFCRKVTLVFPSCNRIMGVG